MLRLVIQQHRPPRTRFTVKFLDIWAAFNTFEEVKNFLHDMELDNLAAYSDLTEDDLQCEIDQEFIRLTNHLRAG